MSRKRKWTDSLDQKTILIWLITVAVVALTGVWYWKNSQISRNRSVVDARIISCFQSRSQGLIVEYEFTVDSLAYRSTEPCQACRVSCSTEACCYGFYLLVEYATNNPETNRIADGAIPHSPDGARVP